VESRTLIQGINGIVRFGNALVLKMSVSNTLWGAASAGLPIVMNGRQRLEIFEITICEGHNFRQAEKANTWKT